MNRFVDSASLLEEIVETSTRGKLANKISSLGGLLQVAKIKPGVAGEETILEQNDQYHLALLRELYREIKFYYVLWQRNQDTAEARLNVLLKGFARTAGALDSAGKDFFFKSVQMDVECTWFIIGTLTGLSNADSDYYKTKLSGFIKHSMQLTGGFKAALVHAKTENLAGQLQKVYTQSTLRTRLDLMDIMHQRQELDETWIESVLTGADKILHKKADDLISD